MKLLLQNSILCLLLLISTVVSAQSTFEPADNSTARKLFKQGNDAFNRKDMRKAIGLYQEAIDAFPKYVAAYDNIGLAYRYLSVPDSSELWLNKSVKINPRGITARERLAVLYQRQRKFDQALEQYEFIKADHPREAAGFYGAATVLLATKSFEKARINASRAIEIYRRDGSAAEGDATMMLGVIYLYEKDMTNARAYLRQAESMGVKVPDRIKQEAGL